MERPQARDQNPAMPRRWTPDPARFGEPLPPAAAAALIDVAAGGASAGQLLRAVATTVPVSYLSVVSLRGSVPQLLDGGAQRPEEAAVVAACFARYQRQGIYRSDDIVPLAEQMARRPGDGPLMLHRRADELRHAGWSQLYRSEHLTDRFSVLHAPAEGDVQAIHVYRDERLGPLADGELQRLLTLLPLLQRACAAASRGGLGRAQDDGLAAREHRLQRLAPALSPRERAVCARVAAGLSVDGIAADLDVAPSTVRTLRKRAYGKLADAGHPAHRLGLARLLA